MHVYDPYAHTVVPLRECEVVETDGEYVAVRSRKEGKWFALHMPTNGTIKLSLLGEDAVYLEEAINRRELQEKVLAACRREEGASLDESIGAEGLTRKALADAVESYGKVAVNAAILYARSKGFQSEAVMHALGRIDALQEDVLEGVEVVRVSELVE